MNSHRLATFQDIRTEVKNVKQAQSAAKARSGDAMDVDVFTKGSKGASKGSGKKQDSEIVCWNCKFPIIARSKGTTTGHMSKDCRSKETSAFEAGDELAETGCIEMASVDLNALEQRTSYSIRFACCSACVSQECCERVSDARHARQNEELQTSVRQASSRSGCAKSPSQIREPESCGHAQSVDDGVRDERHGTRCFLPKEQQKHQGVRVPREQGTKLELERASGVFELPVELVSYSQSTYDFGPLQTEQGVQCNKSHERSSLATSRQCRWKFWKLRRTRFQAWSQEDERGPNEESNCNVRLRAMQRKGRL